MENVLLYALQVSGVGIVALLLFLILFAVIVYLMTRYIKDKPDAGESSESEVKPIAESVDKGKPDLKIVAAIALAIARAQAEIGASGTSLPEAGKSNPWHQFQLQRRLTQSSTIRRTR
jgi:Na+-transporting methylmalonyl-CoA/oxaloacetate decarboxylase gamma subunit